MKYYLVVGERSGDLHASNLMKELKRLDAQADFRYFGGEQMQAVGGVLVRHYQEMAIMGFLEVLLNLRKMIGFLKDCKKDILAYQPDVVILVDYAGFNMRIAAFCKQKAVKTFYYISPKIWAWNTKRALKIKKNVDKMFVILPFEKDFYKQFGYEVDYVGNPLLDAICNHTVNPDFLKTNRFLPNQKIIALLPGSRKSEVKNILPLMLSVYEDFKDFRWVVAGVENLSDKENADLYKICEDNHIAIVYGQTYDLLAHAHVAVVTSGTATLETGLWAVPQVVCFKASTLSYQIAKMLIKVRYISLINLILDKKAVVELIQDDLNDRNLRTEITNILAGEGRESVLREYKQLKNTMGQAGASAIAAEKMWNYLKNIALLLLCYL